MSVYRIAHDRFQELTETTFAEAGLQERKDLQRLIKKDVRILGSDLKMIDEEFNNWEDSDRRIDLLCIDKKARIVVIELKRTVDGGHMELQAIRYAAMVSSMTFKQIADRLARTLSSHEDPSGKARADLLSFLEWESEDALSPEVRIILASADFSVEVTTTVMWLNRCGLNITCIRVKPYLLGTALLADVQQIIPLPEAADYEVRIREQEQENKKVRSGYETVWSGIWYANVDEGPNRSWEDMREYGFIAAGGGPRWINPLRKLKIGQQVYAYQSEAGYVGHGVVSAEAVPAHEFQIGGIPIDQKTLRQTGLIHDRDDLEKTEWLVGIRWLDTVPVSEAKKDSTAFSNQASACRLTHLQTLSLLKSWFK